MRHQHILVLGGSGFVGSAIVSRLVNAGRQVTVAARRREHAQKLILLPSVDVIEADVHDAAVLRRLLQGKDAVINLVGILNSDRGVPYGKAFARNHVELPQKIVAACRAASVGRMLHMSAMGAADDGSSMYLRSKAAGEHAVLGQNGLNATVFRPSVIFGPNDQFLNMFAKLARYSVVMPLAGAQARMQPVSVDDVAHAFLVALDRLETYGKTYELAGPREYRLIDLVRFAMAASGHTRPIVSLPEGPGRLMATVFEALPMEPLISHDNLDSLKTPNVRGSTLPGVAELAAISGKPWHLTPLDQQAAEYLAGRHARTRFERFRRETER